MAAVFAGSGGPATSSEYDAQINSISASLAGALTENSVRSVAVLDLTDLQGTPTELGRLLAEELATSLVLGKSGLDVVDRANLNRLLEENKLSRSGLVDPNTIKRLGKIVGVDAFATGTYTPLGDSLRISIKVIDAETAKVVGAARGDIRMTTSLRELMRARLMPDEVRRDLVNKQESTRRAAPSAAPITPARTRYDLDSVLVNLSGITYNKSSNAATVLVDLSNKRGGKRCISLPTTGAVSALDERGVRWLARRVSGVPVADPRQDQFGYNFLHGASLIEQSVLRIGIELEPEQLDAGYVLSVSLSMWIHNNSCGRTGGRTDKPTVAFDRMQLAN